MRNIYFLFLLCIIFENVVGPPVTGEKKKEEDNDEENEINSNTDSLDEMGIEYRRYLKEVVNLLENDPEFRDKLNKADESAIKSGGIAQELEFVNHNVRTKLDEVKRKELERLRDLARKEFELKNGIDTDHLKIPPEHIDHSNPHTFEIEDLRKLIMKTTQDIAEADKKRRAEFKQYEMGKEFEKQEQMQKMDEEHKKKFMKEVEEREKKHKKHEPLHHPGSKQQLQEVWETQDHMQNHDFDPKAFFYLHDLDGNGYWDEVEVKALFKKELDKMYSAGTPEDDMKERAEEMERMREHVFKQVDTNRDGLISFEEFKADTQRPEFNSDPGWEGLDEQKLFTEEEYRRYEKRRQKDIEEMIKQGLINPPPPGYEYVHADPYSQHPGQVHPNQIPPSQYHQGQMPQGPAHPGAQYQQMHPQQFQQHPGNMPGHPAQYQQAPGYNGHPGQFQQGHPGQFQQGQAHPGQFQQGQAHPGQFQQVQGHPGQFQQGQAHPGQFQQGQVHPGQFQQGQVHPGQFQQGQGHPGQFQQGQVHPDQYQQAHPNQFHSSDHPGQLAGQDHSAQLQGPGNSAHIPVQGHPSSSQQYHAQGQPSHPAQDQKGQIQQGKDHHGDTAGYHGQVPGGVGHPGQYPNDPYMQGNMYPHGQDQLHLDQGYHAPGQQFAGQIPAQPHDPHQQQAQAAVVPEKNNAVPSQNSLPNNKKS